MLFGLFFAIDRHLGVLTGLSTFPLLKDTLFTNNLTAFGEPVLKKSIFALEKPL